MSQVSRRILRRGVEKRIFEIFVDSFRQIRNTPQVTQFIEDLLSPTEKTMLAKRLSIAFLLSKDYDQRAVCRILRVSLCTVNRVSATLKIKGNGYRWVIKQIERREDFEELLASFADLFDALPPKGSSWAKWRSRKLKRELSRHKPF